jgi:hypothetical protein
MVPCVKSSDLRDETSFPFGECDRLQEFRRQLTDPVTLKTQNGINPTTRSTSKSIEFQNVKKQVKERKKMKSKDMIIECLFEVEVDMMMLEGGINKRFSNEGNGNWSQATFNVSERDAEKCGEFSKPDDGGMQERV